MKNMENKYYTPLIEEFHVGFRYELLKGDKWNTKTVSEDDITLGDYNRNTDLYPILYNHVKVRVKYLDKADIEELGWIQGKLPYQYFQSTYMLVSLDHNQYSITNKRYDEVEFRGTIKNYNELKKIMEMLNIK